MSSMFFKNILIADVQEHTARFVSFEQGVNVLTGTENHVGKSSIIKSLYNTLGAEVHFDEKWNKETKLTVVTIDINGMEYRVVRFLKKFALFKGSDLLLLTTSVSKELAPKLAELFNFSVYLVQKNGGGSVQAPPAFTFMPYYIDQDKGWSELYDSFDRIEQFSKSERIKSLYFHLGIYTKSWIENQAKKDILKAKITELQEHEKSIKLAIETLVKELNNIIPADNVEELERQLAKPNKEIETLVQIIGNVRNKIQELQTTLQKHENQLDIVRQFQQINLPDTETKKTIMICPKCGYEFDNDLYELVRSNYNQTNAEYLLAQIQLIVNNIRAELEVQKNRYVTLMADLKKHERAYDETREAYDSYLRQRGLKDTLRKLQKEFDTIVFEQLKRKEEISKIKKELRIIPDKKEIEDHYISHVKENIITLGAWTQAYEGNIKLLKPLNAQGSLMPKIILSQYNGLFQTMADIHSKVIRFPFVVDSPREKESSDSSSKDILTMITKIVSLPQVIVATVDYDRYIVEDDDKVNKIYLTEQFKVLNEETYSEKAAEIEGLRQLLIGGNNYNF